MKCYFDIRRNFDNKRIAATLDIGLAVKIYLGHGGLDGCCRIEDKREHADYEQIEKTINDFIRDYPHMIQSVPKKLIQTKSSGAITETELRRRVRWLMKYENMKRRQAENFIRNGDYNWSW